MAGIYLSCFRDYYIFYAGGDFACRCGLLLSYDF